MSKISIIVPVYNMEVYLEECLNSLIAQSYSNLEIICVNNGCSDSSAEILERYTYIDSRITIITLPKNIGMPAARNLGLNSATGEFVSFVDSDDMCDRTMFDKLHDIAFRQNCDLVVCNVLRFTNEPCNGFMHHPNNWYIDFGYPTSVIDRPQLFMEQAGWAKLYRLKYLLSINFSFTEGSLCCEDVPCATKAFISSDKIGAVQEPLYFYRNREGSISNAMDARYTQDFIYAMRMQSSIISDENITDDNVLSYITEMKFLMSLHILSKMKREDIKDYFDKIHTIFYINDENHLNRFFEHFKGTRRTYNLITNKKFKTYLLLNYIGKSKSKMFTIVKSILKYEYIDSNSRKIKLLTRDIIIRRR